MLKQEILDELNDAWLNIQVKKNELIRPIDLIKKGDPDEFHHRLVWLLSQPEYFSFFCKVILNVEILPFQALVLKELWSRKFPMFIASRGASKSFTLALYAMIRAILLPSRKVVIVGSAFRQSKVIFDYMSNIWSKAPVLRDIAGPNSGPRSAVDVCYITIGDSVVKALPIGDGEKIRGQRAHDILADEFGAQTIEIFEKVIAGFGVVSSSPSLNVKTHAMKEKAEKMGLELSDLGISLSEDMSNQIVLAGTAYYDFNHFANYWKKWKAIVQSKGNKNKIKEIFGEEGPPYGFNWKDYSVIRLPYELLPRGFMDDAQVARSKATVHNGVFLMEYGSCFATDSQGFFKRSLIEACVTSDKNPVTIGNKKIVFDPLLRGNPQKKYVMGVDTASERDNFSIVIIEVNDDHKRVVYCWTTTRKQHIEKVSHGLTKNDNFYAYCGEKIRELMKDFNIERICMDSQGGGIAIGEYLHDTSNGQTPVWEIIDNDSPKDSDYRAGLHILEYCVFARQEWVRDANHFLRKDFEDRLLLFPRFDAVLLGLSIEQDKMTNKTYDTFEDSIMEIEELKNELALIVMSKTNSGRDRWDVPETKIGVGKKAKMNKDRYSALLMANYGTRAIKLIEKEPEFAVGGFIGNKSYHIQNFNKGVMYDGPDWFVQASKGVY